MTVESDREARYAEAIYRAPGMRNHMRYVYGERSWEAVIARAAMAVADAEQQHVVSENDRLTAKVERLNGYLDKQLAVVHAAEAKVSELEASLAMVGRAPSDLARAVTAEAKLARVETLHADDGSGYCDACPSLTLWPEECRTLSALRGTDEPSWEPQSRIPLHRSGDHATMARCGTCDGGGCMDCTDPA